MTGRALVRWSLYLRLQTFTWHDDSPRNEEIKSVESFQNISTWLDAQWWLVEHSDWTWAKATSWLDLGSGPVGREREIVVPSHGSLGHTDYWTVDGHVTIISNRTIRTRPDPYTQIVGTLVFVVRKVGMIWYLWSFQFIFIYSNWKSVIFSI